MLTEIGPCQYCGHIHKAICPRIKAVDFYPNGTQKRVELWPVENMVIIDGVRLWKLSKK